LRYWLESPEFLAQALASKGATDMADYINLRDQRRMRITLPPQPLQHQIAEVLGGLDDLIENNRRRIELLEQMAQAIYREWFVRFRYPGHEDATLVDSPLGPIPDGWEVSTCGEALTVLGGGTPSKKEPAYWEGGTIPWYTPSDLTRRQARFADEPGMRITEEGLRRSSARLFPGNPRDPCDREHRRLL
jgi:type I restriction enzyme S subunit